MQYANRDYGRADLTFNGSTRSEALALLRELPGDCLVSTDFI